MNGAPEIPHFKARCGTQNLYHTEKTGSLQYADSRLLFVARSQTWVVVRTHKQP